MKYFITLLTLTFLFTIPTSFAQLIVKDQDSTPNTLLQVNDEGTAGSITLPPLSAIGTTTNKLYNIGNSLFWHGTALGTAGSAGGWNDGGSIVQLSTITDKVGIGTPAPSTKLHVNGDDGVLFTGVYGSGITLSLTSGTFLLWYPKKAAFRAGSVSSSQWSDASIGHYSAALGYNSTAGGNYSTAMGGFCEANQEGSIAIGYNTTASGNYSTAIGNGSTASGSYSTAMGQGSIASGFNSTAFGLASTASGSYSSSSGYYTKAEAQSSTAFGRYNIGGGNSSSWVSTDPLFEIGNGTSTSDKSNAVTVLKNGKVGIGTAYPKGELEVFGNDGVIFGGAYGSGTAINFLERPVMMWYPKKAAFRAGYQKGTNWDDANIGNYSTAFGYNNTANGATSTAFGADNTASGGISTVIGRYSTASDDYAVAIGYSSDATNYSSTAIGYNVAANGTYSTALGSYVQVTGEGTFFIGDHSTTITTSKSAANRFHARFVNGYYLYTGIGPEIGVYVGSGGNSWSSISDSTKKENFKPTNGEDVLEKISKFRLGSWNYIGQDPAEYRHYGPMAQDFYAAFGYDGIGTIGCDTLLSSADFDGINLIAIQALEKRTKEQEARIKKLEGIINLQKTQNSELEIRLRKLESKLNSKRFTSAENNILIGN